MAKHRQQARQVGVLIKDPPANSMATLNFTSVVPEEDTTFTFDSWVCIANDSGGFSSHLVNPREPEVSAVT
jgi:hypothetical protein